MHTRAFELRDQWAAHNPDLDTSSMEIVGLIRGISGEIDRTIARLYEGGSIKLPELRILLRLRYSSRPTIARNLAEKVSLTPAAISKTLASLEKRGLIARKPSPTNRRAALVSITDKGKQAIDGVFPRQLEIMSAVLSGLGEDRTQVVEALHRLLNVLERGAKLKVPAVK